MAGQLTDALPKWRTVRNSQFFPGRADWAGSVGVGILLTRGGNTYSRLKALLCGWELEEGRFEGVRGGNARPGTSVVMTRR